MIKKIRWSSQVSSTYHINPYTALIAWLSDNINITLFTHQGCNEHIPATLYQMFYLTEGLTTLSQSNGS